MKERKNGFNPYSLELVKFKKTKGSNKYLYLPLQFFAVSNFLEEMLETALRDSDGSSFVERSSETEFKWISNKVEEWKRHYKKEATASGAFWDNIFEHYGELDLPVFDRYQADRAICIDTYGGLNKVLKIINTVKPKRKMKDKDVIYDNDIDELLGSLDGDPLKANHRELGIGLTDLASNSGMTNVCTSADLMAGQVQVNGDLKVDGDILVYDGTTNEWVNAYKGKNMTIENAKNVVVDEVKELVNQSGAADIALGRILYNNIKSAMGRTVVKVSFIDKAVAKVSKRMKYKNEVTELVGVLVAMVLIKQFYDHKALENVRGYIVNRLYTIGIEATGFDDVLALIAQAETKVAE